MSGKKIQLIIVIFTEGKVEKLTTKRLPFVGTSFEDWNNPQKPKKNCTFKYKNRKVRFIKHIHISFASIPTENRESQSILIMNQTEVVQRHPERHLAQQTTRTDWFRDFHLMLNANISIITTLIQSIIDKPRRPSAQRSKRSSGGRRQRLTSSRTRCIRLACGWITKGIFIDAITPEWRIVMNFWTGTSDLFAAEMILSIGLALDACRRKPPPSMTERTQMLLPLMHMCVFRRRKACNRLSTVGFNLSKTIHNKQEAWTSTFFHWEIGLPVVEFNRH